MAARVASPEAEVHGEVAGGGVTDAAGDGADLQAGAGVAADLGADRGPVAFSSGEAELQPVPGRIVVRGAIPPEFDGRVEYADRGIKAAVAIEVGKDHAAMQRGAAEAPPALIRDIFKAPAAVVEDAVGLRVRRIESSAGDEQIEPAVVVEIHQPAAPAAPFAAQVEEAGARAAIVEGAVALVEKDFVGFVLQAGHDDVGPAIAVDVAEVRAHAGDVASIAVVGYAGLHADFLKALAAIAQAEGCARCRWR